MKVVVFLVSLCAAFVLAAPAPIFDQEKRDVPPSVVTPFDDSFSNNAPSDASSTDVPIAEVPIPVNSFDFGPPSSAQSGDVPPSNGLISGFPPPINPFDNNPSSSAQPGDFPPSNFPPSNVPVSAVPPPVNPFENNPPGSAQPGDVPPSNVPVSAVPPPVNPFENNPPSSGGFPPSPNIIATINAPGTEDGSPTANVVACDGPNFTGTCVRVVAPLGQCVTGPAGTRADGTTSSLQIADDLLCTFFDPPDCPLGQAFGTFRSPGISDLSVTQYDNTVSSFFCVQPDSNLDES